LYPTYLQVFKNISEHNLTVVTIIRNCVCVPITGSITPFRVKQKADFIVTRVLKK
jgi:hypothetical protein